MKSPENYLGLERTQNFASPGGAELDRSRVYAAPGRMSLNQWALAGDWTIGNQAVVLNRADGRIVYRFHSRDLHLVMGPSRRESPVRFRVSMTDNRPALLTASTWRRRQRYGDRTAVVSVDSTTGTHRRSTIPDRVPRSWSGGVRLHIRLSSEVTHRAQERSLGGYASPLQKLTFNAI